MEKKKLVKQLRGMAEAFTKKAIRLEVAKRRSKKK